MKPTTPIDEARSLVLAMTEGRVPLSAFVDASGHPVTTADVQAEIVRVRRKRGLLRYLDAKANDFFALGQLHKLSNKIVSVLSSRFSWLGGGGASSMVRFALCLVLFQTLKRQMSALQARRYQQALTRWTENRMKIAAKWDDRPVEVCVFDGRRMTVQELRAYMVRTYPDMTALVLVHPSGRLLRAIEIIQAFAHYSRREKLNSVSAR